MWRMLDTRGGTWVQLVKDNKEGNGGRNPTLPPFQGSIRNIFMLLAVLWGSSGIVFISWMKISRLFQQLSENSDDLYGFWKVTICCESYAYLWGFMFCWQFRDQHLAPGWLYALSQCGLFVGLFVVFIVGMGLLIEWRTMQFRCLTLVASDIQLCQPGDKRE